MTSAVHDERIDTVMEMLRRSGARSVLDLGCGTGDLLLRLAAEPRFERILGLEIDTAAIETARRRLVRAGVADRVELRQASFGERHRSLAGFDAAAMVETIEHVEPTRLSAVEFAVFAAFRPGLILITTPNADYNALLPGADRRRRHPDHRFEWSRHRFETWARGVAARHGYAVAFTPLGWPHPSLGAPTQMATFRRRSDHAG